MSQTLLPCEPWCQKAIGCPCKGCASERGNNLMPTRLSSHPQAPQRSAERPAFLTLWLEEHANAGILIAKDVLAYISALEAAQPTAALEALADVMSLFKAEGEGSTECLERLAEQFTKDTGMMAPFKSQSPYDRTHTEQEREDGYNKWRDEKVARGFAALAQQPQGGHRDEPPPGFSYATTEQLLTALDVSNAEHHAKVVDGIAAGDVTAFPQPPKVKEAV
jgi:hypothetical protein